MSLSLFGTPRKSGGRSRTPSQTPMRGIRFPSHTPPPIHHDDLEPLVTFHAVHVHLPSATTSSRHGSSEVPHYGFPYDQLDVEDDFGDEGVQDGTRRYHPEHATSVSYLPTSSTLARIVENGKTLELRYIAPTSSKRQKSNHCNLLRVDFTSTMHDVSVSTCFYRTTEGEGRITLVLIDKRSRIYRLSFPDPKERVERGLTAFEWNVQKLHVGWLMMSEPDMVASGMTLNGEEPLVWHVVDEDNLIIAARDGLMRCTLVNDDWTHEYFKRPSSFRMFRSDPASQTRIISFRHDSTTELVYAVTRDKKLRIWNAQTLNHESVIDLAQTSGSNEPRRPEDAVLDLTSNGNMASSPLVQILPGTEDTPYDKYVVVFTPTPRSPEGAGYFQVFGALGIKKDLTHVGFLTCSSQTVGMDFRGFHVEHVKLAVPRDEDGDESVARGSNVWRLWVAWDLKGKPFFEWSDLAALFEPREEEMGVMASSTWKAVSSSKESLDLEPMFDAAYFDALNEGIEDGSLGLDDIARYFVDHLFYPGRFSRAVLRGALREYVAGSGEAPMEEESEVFKTLRDQIGETVGRQLVPLLDEDLDYHEQTDSRRRFKLEWQAFWIMVQQHDIQGRWPISVVPMNSGESQNGDAAMVLCREGFIVPAIEDSIALIRRLLVDRVDLDLEELQEPVDIMETKRVKDLLQAPTGTLQRYHPFLADQDSRSFAIIGMASASMLAQSLHPEEFFEFQKHAYSQTRVRRLAFNWSPASGDYAGSGSMNGLDVEVPQPLRNASDPRKVFHATLDLLVELPREQTAGDSCDTFTGLSLRVSNIHQIVAARQLVASEVLLLACHMLSGTSNYRIPEHKNVYYSIAHRALAVFHAWETLRRLSEKHSDEGQHAFHVSSETSTTINRAAFAALREEWKRGGDVGSSDETAYSLLHSVLQEKPQTHSAREFTPESLGLAAFRNLLQLGLVTDKEDMEAGAAESIFALDILLSGNTENCLEFVESLPQSAGISYVASRALIVAGVDSDSGVDGLSQVAAVLARPEWVELDKTGLVSVLPDRVRWNGLAEYYKHAHAVCKTAQLAAPAIMFAKRSIAETEDPHAAQSMMRYVFQEYLSSQQYEEAWQAMLANPIVDHDSTEDDRPLGAIIHSMCKTGQAQRLFSLPISGMEGYIEDELDLRARTADPLASPFYHKILYSWLIMRQDYRKAALTMYQYAERVRNLTARSPADYRSHLLLRSRSLLTASNSLSLVDTKNAWFTTIASSKPGTDERSHKRARVACNVPASAYTQGIRREMDIVTLDQVKKESDLVLAALMISSHTGSDLDPALPLTANDCIAMLSESGLFDQAFATASVQEVDKTVVFEFLTARCLEMNGMTDEAVREVGLSTWLDASSITATWHGSLSEKAWKYLDSMLSRHDVISGPSEHVWGRKISAGTNFTYHLAVLNKILELDPEYAVPQWLTGRLVERCPDALIRSALKIGATEKAAVWARDCLKWAQKQKPRTVGAGIIAPQYSPFNTVDQVIAAAKGSEDKAVKVAVDALQAEASRRFKGIKSLMSTLGGV